jgi:predicted metal-dependent hydrolase
VWTALWTDSRRVGSRRGHRALSVPGVTVRVMSAVPLRSVAGERVEVRRSTRRRRTVSAYREGDHIVVLLPARTTRADEAKWVEELVGKIVARERRGTTAGPKRSDAALLRRARELNRQYLGGRAEPDRVRWVGPLRSRWASCTPAEKSIRVSERLRGMPSWVLDYVLVHELAHLLEPGHGPRFWALVAAYPRTERARGYLDGVSAAAGLGIEPDTDEDAVDEIDDLDD